VDLLVACLRKCTRQNTASLSWFSRCWLNVYPPPPPPLSTQSNLPIQIGFTHAVLDDLLRTYPAVDPRQIFITGSSNGGSMAVRVACEMPERVAAVGPEIGSLEAVDGNRCADRCVPEGDGVYEMCEWNNQLPDCAPTVFLKNLPGVFSCNRLKEHPTPMLFFNGNLDPYSNISGLIERPIKPGNATLCESPPNRLWLLSGPPWACACEWAGACVWVSVRVSVCTTSVRSCVPRVGVGTHLVGYLSQTRVPSRRWTPQFWGCELRVAAPITSPSSPSRMARRGTPPLAPRFPSTRGALLTSPTVSPMPVTDGMDLRTINTSCVYGRGTLKRNATPSRTSRLTVQTLSASAWRFSFLTSLMCTVDP
jgi:hypothetical protein